MSHTGLRQRRSIRIPAIHGLCGWPGADLMITQSVSKGTTRLEEMQNG